MLGALGFVACVREPTSTEQQLDLEAYDALVADLDERREEFLGEGASGLVADGPNLFWLSYGLDWDPTVHALEPGGAPTAITELSGGDLNWRVSEDLLVTAVPRFGEVEYRAFDLRGEPVGTTTVSSPSRGVSWWAYAPDGPQVWMVDEEADAVTRFAPGEPPELVTTFADLGVDVGEFWDFDIDGDEMLFVESGRLWLADLGAGTASSLGNDTEVDRAATFDGGVVYGSAAGLFAVDPSTGETLDLTAAIEANPYELSPTNSRAHLPSTDGQFSLVGTVVVYVGQTSGVYAYDVVADEVEPILLPPRSADLRVDYRNPVVTDDGVLYVTGLTSTSGAVGVDGPVYRVEHPFLTGR